MNIFFYSSRWIVNGKINCLVQLIEVGFAREIRGVLNSLWEEMSIVQQ